MNTKDFNIDDWIALGQSDPAAFEEKKLQYIANLINSAPNERIKRILQGLQFKIDAVKSTTKNQYDCLIKLSNMMFESVAKLQLALNGDLPSKTTTQNAIILDFNQRSSEN